MTNNNSFLISSFKAFARVGTQKITYGYAARTCIVFAILLLHNNFIAAQDPSKIEGLKNDLAIAANDSDRVDALSSLCMNYSDRNADTALLYGEQAMQLAVKINYLKGRADSYNNLGWAYYRRSDMRKAETYFRTAFELFKQTGVKKNIKIPLANLGTMYMDETEYAKSLDCFMQVLRYDDEINDPGDTTTWVNKAATLHDVGRLYNLMQKPAEARTYFLQALQISKSVRSNVNIGENLMSIGNTYLSENDPRTALKYYTDCLAALEKSNDKYRIGLTHENIGGAYLKLKNYEEAIRQYKLAKDSYLGFQSKTDMFYVCMGLAEVYNTLKDSINGNSALNEALQYASELNNKSNYQQAILGLSDFYKSYGNHKKAYEYLDSAHKLKDSLFSKEKQEAAIKLQTQFETERKEKQIELLQKGQLLNQASLQRHKIFQYAAFVIIGLLVLIGFLIINRYRSVQRTKRFTEIEQMRNNIARDLHDDIGSTLTSINILSKVAIQQAGEANGPMLNIQKIKERSADIMDRMNDIIWAINPANDTLDKILLRMKEFASELCEQSGIQCTFNEVKADISNVLIALNHRSGLYLIFKEALNNAVKHSAAKTIDITVKKEGGKLRLTIADDGKGFAADQSFSANSVKNMSSRAREIDAIFQLRSTEGNGTSITLDIPVT